MHKNLEMNMSTKEIHSLKMMGNMNKYKTEQGTGDEIYIFKKRTKW